MNGIEIPVFIASAVALDKLLKAGFTLNKESTFRLGKIKRPNITRDEPLTLEKVGDNVVLSERMKKLESKLSHHELAYFHSNVKNLKVTERSSLLSKVFKKEQKDSYNPRRNKITLQNASNGTITMHDMLHLASTTREGGDVLSGFSQDRHFVKMGFGLNQGYTQLLNRRYFNRDCSFDSCLEEMLAEYIEKIVGQDQMEYYYLIGELKYLHEDIAKYTSKEEADALIVSLDIINKYYYKDKKTKRQEDLVNKAIGTSVSIIKDALLEKLEEQDFRPSAVSDYYASSNVLHEILKANNVDDQRIFDGIDTIIIREMQAQRKIYQKK